MRANEVASNHHRDLAVGFTTIEPGGYASRLTSLRHLFVDYQLLRPLLGGNVTLSLLLENGLRPALADRSQLEQVIVNGLETFTKPRRP